MAGFADLAPHVEQLLPKISAQLELVSVHDGARCITAHAKLAAAGVPPLVVVLKAKLEHIDGAHAAHTIRAVERGMGASASAVLYVCEEGDSETSDDLVANVGRAVILKWRAGQPAEQSAQRLVRAMAKILEQLRKRGKA